MPAHRLSLLRQSAGTFLLQGAGAAFQLAAGVLLARALLAEGRGLYGLLVLVPSTALLVAGLGYGTAALQAVSRERRRDGPALAGALLLSLVAGGGVAALLLFLRGPLLAFVGPADPAALHLALAALPLLVLDQAAGQLLVAQDRVVASQAVKALQSLAFLGTLGAGFALRGPSVTVAVAAWTLSYAAGDLLAVLWLVREMAGPLRLDLAFLRARVAFGLRVVPASIGMFLLFRVDLWLLRAFRELDEVGVYALATSLAVLFQLFTRTIEKVATPRILGRDDAARARYTPRVVRAFLLAALPLALVAGAAAFPLIPLVFGEPFRGSATVFALFLPGLVVANVGILLNCDLIARGRPGIASLAATACLAVNIGLNLLWIPRYGTVGAALASLVCYSLYGVLIAVAHRRVTASPLAALLPRPADARDLFARLRRRGAQEEPAPASKRS